MNVSDLLKQCPAEDILAALPACDSLFDDVEKRARESYRAVIDELKGRPVIPDDEGHLILGQTISIDGRDRPDVSLFFKADIERDFEPVPELDSIEDIDALSDDDVERLLFDRSLPTAWAIDFTSWNVILGYSVDEGNIRDVGAPNLLAALLYEMTFHGFDEADMEAERDELERRADEIDKIMDLPPDEQKKHFKSADDVMAELGIVDNRTEEERDADLKVMYREDLHNKLQIYHAIRKYKERMS